jgi:hypothetical protein
MVQFKKVSQPVVVKKEEFNEAESYYIEQDFNVEGYNFTIKHKCLSRKDGSISITDYDNDKNESLNEEVEKQLCSHFDICEAFELYELMTMEAETEVNNYLK